MRAHLFIPLFTIACAGNITSSATDAEPDTAPLPEEAGDEQSEAPDTDSEEEPRN